MATDSDAARWWRPYEPGEVLAGVFHGWGEYPHGHGRWRRVRQAHIIADPERGQRWLLPVTGEGLSDLFEAAVGHRVSVEFSHWRELRTQDGATFNIRSYRLL